MFMFGIDRGKGGRVRRAGRWDHQRIQQSLVERIIQISVYPAGQRRNGAYGVGVQKINEKVNGISFCQTSGDEKQRTEQDVETKKKLRKTGWFHEVPSNAYD